MSIAPTSSTDHAETGKFGFPIFHAETRAEWRAWLEHHHATVKGVWLVSWRNSHGGPRCPYPEVVEEAICFGWIDSTAGKLDHDRGMQLLTPRKAKSAWTRLNRRRAEEMEAAGLMRDAGRRVIAAAQANGYWTIYDPVEDLEESDELRAALDANEPARQAWNGFPPSARKMMLWWVVSAMKPETKLQRIERIVAKAERGERAQG